MVVESLLAGLTGILVSPVLWKGLNSLLDNIFKNRRLNNREFKEFLITKINEQNDLIIKQNSIIIELKERIIKLETELEYYIKSHSNKTELNK